MAFEYRLHDVGEGIDGAEVLEWHVAVGDDVREDQVLVDVQTDKAIVPLPCPVDGVVLELPWSPGDMVPVGAVLAVLGERSELSELEAAAQPAAVEGAPASAPADVEGAPASPPPNAERAPASAAAGGERAGNGGPPTRDADPVAAGLAAGTAAGRPLASPAVRRLARERGVDLAAVAGSGPHGRIVGDDVVAVAAGGQPDAAQPAAAEHTAAAAPPGAAPAGAVEPSPPGIARADEVVPLRGTRRAIARNLTRSWQEIPHIVDFREADATRLMAARGALRARAESDGDAELAAVLTPLAVISKIVATVALRHPRVNSSVDMEQEQITLRGAIHLAVAIAAPDGLVTPAVRDAQRKAVPAIAREIAGLAAAAGERSLSQEQLSGGTITVNNFGSLGSPFSTPIIPPGQAVNVGLGRIQDKPVARGGEVVVRPILGISCSGDHRALDGKDLSYFVNDLVVAIEDPVLLVGDLA